MDVADLDDGGDLDIIVGNLDTPNVVYFQDGTPPQKPPVTPTSGDFTTTTPIGNDPSSPTTDLDSPTTKVVAADLDEDGKVDLVVANRDEENQIYLAEDATGDVLDDDSLPDAPSSTLALPYNNWPDGFLGAEWQDSLAEVQPPPSSQA